MTSTEAGTGRPTGDGNRRRRRGVADGGSGPAVGQATPHSPPSIGARLRYRFDEMFSRGTAPIILWLAVVTVAIVLLAGLVLSIIHATISSADDDSFVEAVWASMLRTLDPGTMGGDAGWDFRLVSLGVTIAGIFIVSTLIGLIATGLDRKLEALREGRSRIVERGHTLIIGHTQKLAAIVEELIEANANQKDACVVVLSTTDKTEVEHELRARIPDSRTTRIVCRTGDGSDPVDLAIANPLEAKSVVVLAPDGAQGDGFTIRTVLALMTFDPELAHTQVVAELCSSSGAEALRRVTKDRVLTIVSDDTVGRLAAQACREDGLSTVYQELFDFSGDEIYFQAVPELTGRTFAEAVLAFEEASVMGLRYADGSFELAPSPATVLGDGDQVIAIAEDDDKIVFTGSTERTMPAATGGGPAASRAEHVLVSGWSAIGPIILRELDQYVGPGSTVHVVADPRHCDLPATADFAGLTNLTVEVSAHGHHDVERLLQIFEGREPDHVLLLCYRERLIPTQADAEVLMSLLQLRHVIDERGGKHRPTIVAELLDPRDVALAQVSGADDFLVSFRLTSLLIAQLAENPELDVVFEDLLDVKGAEIHLWPVPDVAADERPRTYGELVRAGLADGDVVIGYRTATVPEGVETLGGGVVVNPPKSSAVDLRQGDAVIVVTHRG